MIARPDLDIDRWIRRLPARGEARVRLIGFPYAGGSASIFREWGERLGPSVEMIAVQLPGRGDRLEEQRYTDLKALVRALALVTAGLLDRPVVFWGHSFGAILAFETIHQLQRQAAGQLAGLFVSAHRAPQIARPNDVIHLYPDAQFWTRLREMNGIPAEILERPELRQVYLPILRADIGMSERYLYLPRPPLACPVTVFGGKDDPMVDLKGLASWRAQTTGRFSLKMLPGDHFFIHSAQPALLETISAELERIG